MLDFVLWYLIITIVGWISFPILFYLLPNLPDRGATLSKIFGFLFWGYLYWILGRLGITSNSLAGLIFPLIITAGIGLFAYRKVGGIVIREWIYKNRTLIITAESLFLIAFAGWAVIRSLNPDILGTEKPMELAFINAILHSKSLPPHDPWLSGYAISYYYFGYILVAMLAKLAGTLGSVAFNLGVSLIFGLSAAGSYGILYNLLTLNTNGKKSSVFPALLGPFFTLIISNWEGFLHYIHAKGIFWNVDTSGQLQSGFWTWFDIQDLVSPPTQDPFGHWWWWRASRVIQDYDFSGSGKEVISEFPFFSFLLADLHPHVLSLPFVFLIITIALELYLRPHRESFRWLGFLPVQLSEILFGVLAWLAGSMAFLNTWNFPMYVAILAGAYVLRNNRGRPDRHGGIMLQDFLSLGLSLGITGGVLFLPWYIGFASQAGGVIPNVLYITKGSQYWVMFGPLLVPIFAWLVYTWRERKANRNLTTGILLSSFLVLSLFIFMLAIVVGINLLPPGFRGDLMQLFLGSVGGSDINQVMSEGFIRRLREPGTLVTLVTISVLGFGMIFNQKETGNNRQDLDTHFVLLLILAGMALTLFPEFVFLRDLFGYRINTIFKFYYQAWLIWSIVAAFGTITLFRKMQSRGRFVVFAGLILSMFMALFYPVRSIQSKTNNFFREGGLTLDGGVFFYNYSPFDAEAAQWLRDASPGVIAEAVGGSYSSSHARMATYSGKPNVLGWDFHEIQWRGDSALVMPRKQDIATLYCTHNWEIAHSILEKYNITYLVVGDVEYSTYVAGSELCPNGLHEDKFNENMIVVFLNERLSIYTPRVTP